MPNDAKLGFLVGVAGVIVAAVMFSQQPQASPPPAVETAAVPSHSVAPPPAPAATPVEKPRAHPAALPRTREELQGRPASRPADEE